MFVKYWKRYRDNPASKETKASKSKYPKCINTNLKDESIFLLNEESVIAKDNLIFDFTTQKSNLAKNAYNQSKFNKSKSTSPHNSMINTKLNAKLEGIHKMQEQQDKKNFNLYFYDTKGKRQLLLSVNNKDRIESNVFAKSDFYTRAISDQRSNVSRPAVKPFDVQTESITNECDDQLIVKKMNRNKKNAIRRIGSNISLI